MTNKNLTPASIPYDRCDNEESDITSRFLSDLRTQNIVQNPQGWSKSVDGDFRYVSNPHKKLPAGIYRTYSVDGVAWYKPIEFPTDEVISLPGLPTDYILNQIEKFWGKKDIYSKYGFVQKRGILLYGPPGSGKTSLIRLLCDALIKRDGVIFNLDSFTDNISNIAKFRSVEPDRPIMTLIEDFEGLVTGDEGAAEIKAALSFLDGENQVSNIVHVATTNTPEALADRFIKRPGRFDLVIGIHAPDAETREAYLRHVTKNQMEEKKLKEMVGKTEGLGLSYLRELASTWLCLDIPLDETLERLQVNFKMKGLKVKKEAKLGFTIGYEGKE